MLFSREILTNEKYFRKLLIVIWLLFLASQAYFTPLHVDECYYWLFGQNLDWGYFDHPPAVALYIYLSDIFASGNLSVRLLTILSQILTFIILYRLVDNPLKKDNRFFLAFFLLFVSLPLNQIYGFITTPDVPLILSTSIFFLAYKKLLKTKKVIWAIVWGITMSAMLYSKYHGVLVIFFVLCSNPKLFLNYKTYLAGIIGIVLFLPHMKWQYDHDFVSFLYHLKERVVIYKQFYPLEYLLNIVLVFNPLFLKFLLNIIKKFKRNEFERSLYFTLFGFLLFFGFQSFRVQVQPQWIVLVYIPFIILIFNEVREIDFKGIKIKFLITLPFLISLHVFMVWDLLPLDLNLHRKKAYVEEITNDANGSPVVFYGSYNHASIYSWYSSQKFTHSYNGPTNRKNQFNIWEMDSIYHNKEVYLVGTYFHDPGDKIYEGGYSGIHINYEALDNITIEVQSIQVSSDSIKAQLSIYNPYSGDLDFKNNNRLAVYFLSKEKSRRGRYIFEPFSKVIGSKNNSIIEVSWEKPKSQIDEFGFSVGGARFPFGPIWYKYELSDFTGR